VSAIAFPLIIIWFGRLAPDVVFRPIANAGAGVY
jgi:hypothetical protein